MQITFEGGDGAKHPELFNIGKPKFTGNGISIVGQIKIEDGIASGFSSSSYIETTLNNASLANYLELKWYIKYYLTSYIGARSLLGNTSLRIGIWGTDTYKDRLDYAINSNFSEGKLQGISVPNRYNVIVITHNVQNKTYTCELFDDNDNLISSNLTPVSTPSSYANQNWRIGNGINGGSATEVLIDLNVTRLEADGEIISPWNR